MITTEIFEIIVPVLWIFCDKCSLSDKTADITAILISGYASAVTLEYGYKYSVLPLVLLFYA
jgi:hypothetical protein